MGETTSSWNVPLHSSDSEHPWMKRRDSKGKGGAFKLNMRDGRQFPMTPAEAIPGIQESNPFDKDAD